MKLLQNNSKSEMGGWRVVRPLFHPTWKLWKIQVYYFENHGSTFLQPNSSKTGGLVADLRINDGFEGGPKIKTAYRTIRPWYEVTTKQF